MSEVESRQATAPQPRRESFMSRFFSGKKKSRRLSVHKPSGPGSPSGTGRSEEEVLKKMRAAEEIAAGGEAGVSSPKAERKTFQSVSSTRASHPSRPLLTPLLKSLPFGSQNNMSIGDTKQFNKAIDKCLELIRNEAALYEAEDGAKDGNELAVLLCAGADIFKALGCFEEAKQLLQQAVAIRRRLNDVAEEAEPLALCLNDYGVFLLDIQEYAGAIEILQEARVLFSRNQKQVPNQGVAATYANEAIAHRYLRNFSEATSAHENALMLFKESCGHMSEDFLFQKGQLGITLAIAGDNLMAKKVLTEVLSFLPEDQVQAPVLRYELTHLTPSN